MLFLFPEGCFTEDIYHQIKFEETSVFMQLISR